jgi:hypothetical protein
VDLIGWLFVGCQETIRQLVIGLREVPSIWFMVKVPVLSVQTSVTSPRASHADNFRTKLFDLKRPLTADASDIVAMSGKL